MVTITLQGQEAQEYLDWRNSLRPQKVSGPVATAREQVKEIRQWAKEHGLEVAEKGRIPTSVMEAYADAHQKRIR